MESRWCEIVEARFLLGYPLKLVHRLVRHISICRLDWVHFQASSFVFWPELGDCQMRMSNWPLTLENMHEASVATRDIELLGTKAGPRR